MVLVVSTKVTVAYAEATTQGVVLFDFLVQTFNSSYKLIESGIIYFYPLAELNQVN